MAEENNNTEKSSGGGGGNNSLPVIIAIVLIVLLVILGIVLIVFVADDSGGGSGTGEVPTVPPGEVVPTVAPPIYVPTPAPDQPTITVIAPAGANVRSGPGTNYPIIGVAPTGAQAIAVGTNGNRTWVAGAVPSVTGGVGWVLGELVTVEGGDNLPVIPAPAPPTATPLPTATATPSPEAVFTADPTTVNAGGTVTLAWDVENVRAVWVYPVGANFADYPVQGQASKQVVPYVSTTYAMRVEKTDGTVQTWEIPVTVVNGLTTFKWVLESYQSPEGKIGAIPGVEVSAFFNPNGSLSGSGGCNSYSGPYTAYESTISVGIVQSSQLACDQNVMQQEAQYISLLQSAASFVVDRGILNIYDASGSNILSFVQG
jgi:heat shock protein HslJ/uncharacterized protein YraI